MKLRQTAAAPSVERTKTSPPGDELEDFDRNCKKLMDKIKQIIPEGCTRARIRATSRTARKADSEGTLAQTLGDESRGMVVVDFQGHPQTYDSLKIFSDVVAKEACEGNEIV